MMKRISILGSTGSIGTQALDVVRERPDQFQVVALVAYENDELLEKQIEEFSPSLAVLVSQEAYDRLKSRYQGKTELLVGGSGSAGSGLYWRSGCSVDCSGWLCRLGSHFGGH